MLHCFMCFFSVTVFRFSVSSQAVGFHIYKLQSFECANYKIFFNLWHGGGPNYVVEYKKWLAEERNSWTSVGHSSNLVTPPLTGANAIPLRHGFHASSSKAMKFSNFKFSSSSDKASVVKHFNPKLNANNAGSMVSYNQAGVLGPIPNPSRLLTGNGPVLVFCSKCLSPAHSHDALSQ